MKRTEGVVQNKNGNETERETGKGIERWTDFPESLAKICLYDLIVSCSLDGWRCSFCPYKTFPFFG